LLLYTDTLARLSQYGTFLSFEQNLVGEGGTTNISLILAFLGGLVSFLSPCVLPLVPAYLGYLSGTVVGTANVALEEEAAS
jgi:cytochrome c biogenesis protein CcdA